MKKIIAILVSFLALSTFARAEENCSVSGTVTFSQGSDIYICLHTMETFTVYKKELPSPQFLQVINPTKEMLKTGKASFKFESIPKGSYLIVAFQDTNGNEKLDWGGWGFPTEPICFYKESETGMSNWYDMKFDVEKDCRGIELVLN